MSQAEIAKKKATGKPTRGGRLWRCRGCGRAGSSWKLKENKAMVVRCEQTGKQLVDDGMMPNRAN